MDVNKISTGCGNCFYCQNNSSCGYSEECDHITVVIPKRGGDLVLPKKEAENYFKRLFGVGDYEGFS